MASNLTEPQQKSDDERSARRRLIKGSFAAPAALTLCSGSALAAATSPLTCLAKDIRASGAPGAPVTTVETGDTWVRVRAWVEQNKSYAFIKADDVSMVGFKDTTPFITGSQAICVIGGNGYTVGELYPQNGKPVPTGMQQTGQYFAVLMDPSGRVAGISSVNSISGTGAVHGSCWNSFK